MTAVVAVFDYQGELTPRQAEALGASYTHLGVRRIDLNEAEHRISIEYDATRMDQAGVAAFLRRIGIPLAPVPV